LADARVTHSKRLAQTGSRCVRSAI
jgi:hypothetical protein